MKKDSFTFSDKLKKSKTLPLSKRIPSRVGGEVKAKRTLFERAQRDLPFIIVAALALLLLPFLSRESGDIDTPSVVWGDGDSYVEDFNLPKSKLAEGEIALSSFRNPLDLIIRHGQQDSSARDAVDSAYSGEDSGSSAEEGYSSGSSSRSSYGSEEYSSSPATSRYGKTVRRSVRNSINRVPTSIGSLSRGAMVSTNGGNAPSHMLSFGSRSKDAAPKVQGPGVRPVALQPLTAAGKGRDLTGGDALYAEAARSIGAMNKPGAKQALLDAQLKDVDGKPLGETKGGSGPGEGAKPGAGGNMANNWNHSPLKPWWWDMMKDRSQKRWELWHYNWERMASDSLIALTRGLASCLITGSNNFEVSKFLGSPGGGIDFCCKTRSGQEICAGDLADYASSTSGSGKDKETSNHAIEALKMMCPANAEIYTTEASRKSALDVRLRCLGLKLSELKNMTQVRRSAVCDGLSGDPMYIDVLVKRNNKDRMGKLKTTGFYVIDTNGCVIDIQKAKYGKNVILKSDGTPYTKEERKTLKQVVVYRVGKYGTRFYPEGNEDPTFDRDLSQYQNKNGQYYDDDEIYWESGDYDNSFNVAFKKAHAGGCYKEAELQKDLKPIGKWRDSGRRLNEIERCGFAKYFASTEYEPVKMDKNITHPNDTIGKDDIKRMVDCRDTTVFIEAVPSQHKFATTIENPGAYTTAFVLEYVQNAPYANDYVADAKTVSDKIGYRVVRRIDYNENSGYKNQMFTNNDGTVTFIGDVEVGESSIDGTGNLNSDHHQKAPEKARPGRGFIIWTTSNELGGVSEGTILKAADVNSVYPGLNGKHAICAYRWGCGDASICPEKNRPEYCFVIKNPDTGEKTFHKIIYYGDHYLPGVEVSEVDESLAPYQCSDICLFEKDSDPNNSVYNIDGSASLTGLELRNLGVTLDPNCKLCNPEPKRKPVEGEGKCYIDDASGRECYSSVSVEEGGVTYHFITSIDPVACPADVPCTPICADKAKALGILPTTGVGSNVPLNENPLTTEQKAEEAGVPVGTPACPYCSGKCHLDGKAYPCTSFKGNDGQTYHVRTSTQEISGGAEYPCTPICAKKAEALGFSIFKMENNNPVEPSLTDDENDINPVKPGEETLCPFCNPDPDEVQAAKKKCEFVFRDVFDHNVFMSSRGYEDVNKAAADISDCVRMTDIAEINVIGHADRSDQSSIKDQTACPVDDPTCNSTKNNISLSEDRALYITNAVLNKVYPTFTGQVRFAVDFISNPNAAPKTFGKPRYSDYKRSYGSGNRVVTFKVIGRGDANATVTPIYDRNNKATNKEAMAKDRYVEILPFRYESGN